MGIHVLLQICVQGLLMGPIQSTNKAVAHKRNVNTKGAPINIISWCSIKHNFIERSKFTKRKGTFQVPTTQRGTEDFLT